MSNEDKQTATQSAARWMRIEREGLAYKIEAILKDCLSFAIAASIAVFGIGVIIAPSMGLLLVEVVGCLVLMWPSLMFSVFGVHPSSFYFIFLVMVYVTILLCASVVSDGLYVVVFGLMTFLFLGKSTIILMMWLFLHLSDTHHDTLRCRQQLRWSSYRCRSSTKHLCQNGASITFLPDKASDISNLNPIGRIVHASLAIIDVLQTTSDSKIDFVCPEDTGIFAGQICTITKSSSDPAALTASVNGGLYIVAAFWTSTGLNNPFALVYNIMIGTCWTVVCLMLPIFIPPIRRFRDVLRKLIIPGILSSVAALLDSKCKEECNDVDGERQNLSAMAKKLSPKKNARLLYFEPRLCHDPVIDHIPYMETFLNNIHSAVLILYNYSGYRQESDDEEPNHFETTKVIRAVASAVEKNDLSILEEVDVKTINWDDTEGGLDELSLSAIFRDVVSSIYSSSRLWIEAYNNIDIKDEEKHRVTTVRRILKAWFANAICACDSITSSWPFIAIRMFQGKQGAGLQNVSTRRFIMTILWSVKWTGGAVALACVEIYGGLYADWLVRSEMASPDYALLGTMQGWSLFAYFLAFQFSMEGTIKKGMMRALGTCLGGFAAWIGIMLCSGHIMGSIQ